MILYHFTGAQQWPAILASGEISATWPGDLDRLSCARVAHFTSSPDPAALPEARRSSRVRLRVEVPDADARPWLPWLRRNLPPGAHWLLGARRPGNGQPGTWYVTERAVPLREWSEAVDVDTHVCLWPPRPE
ncbi:hypothetical protein ACIHCQ_26850 [Streptomyces sp. NPDC052236]|uniref:hypothetical protein n=1 Tax=Streptomyces sp. NPDC052236 TaxID=3365686 RepID=UPI0037D3FBDA